MRCDWCQAEDAQQTLTTVYWELPDGSRAIEITETPGVSCSECGMVYQPDTTVNEIEDHLMIIDTSKLPKSMTYTKLFEQPKLLKRNYFNFN
ncbi:YokU family protein [Bacillus tianshenii]|nr:YokU family protein [Bacillus tianshenii]